jgi:bifunctional ADP-heptose synthase (sugar kinase/adenylyltransferase)
MREKIKSRADLAAELATRRAKRERIVFTNGCFDLIHLGHVKYGRWATCWWSA